MARTLERTQFLGDIITTAVEGGTGYWAQVSQYQWLDTFTFEQPFGKVMVVVGERQGDHTRATLHEMKDDEDGYKAEGLDLTLDAVAVGIHRIVTGKVPINATLRQTIARASRENDAGDIDADGADAIAQAALLGELVYG